MTAAAASRASVRLQLDSAEEAARVAAALAPENGTHVTVRIDGAALVAEAEAASPLALLHTLDDLLACAAAAQKAGRVGGSRPSGGTAEAAEPN